MSAPIVVRLLRNGKTLVDFYFDPSFTGRVLLDEPVVIDEVTANRVGEALTPFVPTQRQLELMEHAVGGDSRHRNYYCAPVGGDALEPWRALVAAGLAEERPTDGPGKNVYFHVSDSGLALLDARARARILAAKAAAWDSFRATFWDVFDRDDEDDGTLAETAKTFITDWEQANKGGTPAPKGPRAIAGAVVDYLVEQAYMRTAEQPTREIVVEHVAEIIHKALGGAS